MSTLLEPDDKVLAEYDRTVEYLTDQCKEARLEENTPRVQDLSTHISRLVKERMAFAEKSKRLISLDEAKSALAAANDALQMAMWEVAPDYAPAILQRMAELHFENDQPFES